MTTELSTVIYKVDWKYIIKNHLDKKLWKKKWVVFTYNGVKVELSLSTIDVRNGNVNMRVEVRDSEGNWDYQWIALPVDKANYNETVFTKGLYGTIRRILEDFERHAIYKLDIYKLAEAQDEDLAHERRKVAEDFLDENSVTNEVIREAYIDHFMGEFDGAYMQDQCVDRLKYKIHTPNFLMLSLFYNQQDEYARIVKSVGASYVEEADEVMQELQNELDAMDIEDMVEESKKKLEDI